MMESANKIRLCWMEEQELFQKLYDAIFTADGPVTVISKTDFGDFTTLKINLSQKCPDIFMVGCKTVSQDLISELCQLHESYPKMGIIILASAISYEDLLSIRQYMENNKAPGGFFFKKSLTQTNQLFNLLSLVRMGQVIIDPTLSSLLSFDKDQTVIPGGLTAREMEILNLISRGYTNVAISDRLCIDVKTVRHHINNIYSKIKISEEFDKKHPRVTATNIYHRLTGQLTFDDTTIEKNKR